MTGKRYIDGIAEGIKLAMRLTKKHEAKEARDILKLHLERLDEVREATKQ